MGGEAGRDLFARFSRCTVKAGTTLRKVSIILIISIHDIYKKKYNKNWTLTNDDPGCPGLPSGPCQQTEDMKFEDIRFTQAFDGSQERNV